MAKPAPSAKRRAESLSRESIIEASIELLDRSGEEGLTFRALSERLATGAGAIYWHVADKSDLLTAACDVVVERAIATIIVTTPQAAIRALALCLFDLIYDHPWVGSALTSALGLSPMVRILEPLGQHVQALGVPGRQQWAAVGTLTAYILGVSRQNAANGELARSKSLDRSEVLRAVSASWSQLDAREFPFTRGIAARVRDHDDRADFLAGIDLILKGVAASRRRPTARCRPLP